MNTVSISYLEKVASVQRPQAGHVYQWENNQALTGTEGPCLRGTKGWRSGHVIGYLGVLITPASLVCAYIMESFTLGELSVYLRSSDV